MTPYALYNIFKLAMSNSSVSVLCVSILCCFPTGVGDSQSIVCSAVYLHKCVHVLYRIFKLAQRNSSAFISAADSRTCEAFYSREAFSTRKRIFHELMNSCMFLSVSHFFLDERLIMDCASGIDLWPFNLEFLLLLELTYIGNWISSNSRPQVFQSRVFCFRRSVHR